MRSSSRNIAILSSEANIASLRSNEDTQCATSRVLISRFCVMRMTLICPSKQLQEGLMVFSDDFLHFLKIKKKFVEFTKTILWL